MGNDNVMIKKEIENIVTKNLFSQAYIIVGRSINSVNDSALILAKALICPHSYYEGCNKCNICSRIDNSIFSELKIINPENNLIKKEKIISLRNEFQTNSIEGKNLIYIINQAELLNQASANSLLKFVEEPDGNTIAIFTTTNIDKMVPTIISRCKILRIEESKTEEYDDMLNYCNVSSEEVAALIELYKNIHLKKTDVINYKEYILKKYPEKDDIMKVLKFGVFFYNDALKVFYNENTLFQYSKEIFKNDTKHNILKKLEIVLSNLKKLEYNVNIPLFIMNFYIEIGEV